MPYYCDTCEHAPHEYAGSIQFYGNQSVDIYFLDKTGGHKPNYHGCCIRYGKEDYQYASYAEMHPLEAVGFKEQLVWCMYLEWCEARGYEPQTLEWRQNENRTQ